MNNDNLQPTTDPLTPEPTPTQPPITPDVTPVNSLDNPVTQSVEGSSNPVLAATPAAAPAFQAPTSTATSDSLNTPLVDLAQTTPPVAPPVYPASPTATPLPEQPVANAEPPKKKKKGLIAAIIVIVILAVLGGGGALAYNFWYQNPEKVVTDALGNMLKAKSVSYTGNFEFKNEDTTMKIDIDGKNSDQTGVVNVTADITASGQTLNVKGSGLTDKDGNLYVKLSGVEKAFDTAFASYGLTAAQSPYGPLIKKVEDKWIKVAASDLNELSEDAGKTQTCVTDAIKSIDTDSSVKNELVSLYDKNRFIIVGDKLGSKDGSLGYNIKVDPTIAKAYYEGVGTTSLGKKLTACDDSIKFTANDEVDDVAKTDPGTVEVWVSRFTHELTEFNGERKSTEDGDVSFVFKPVFNQAVTVDVPTNTTSVKEIIDEYTKLMGSYSTF